MEDHSVEIKEEIVECGFVEVDPPEVFRLCMACLCATRHTHTLTDDGTLKQYFQAILTETQPLSDKDTNISPRLCWECEVMLKKSVCFRRQVNDSYNILRPMLQMFDDEDLDDFLQTSLCRPGRLRICLGDSVDIPPLRNILPDDDDDDDEEGTNINDEELFPKIEAAEDDSVYSRDDGYCDDDEESKISAVVDADDLKPDDDLLKLALVKIEAAVDNSVYPDDNDDYTDDDDGPKMSLFEVVDSVEDLNSDDELLKLVLAKTEATGDDSVYLDNNEDYGYDDDEENVEEQSQMIYDIIATVSEEVFESFFLEHIGYCSVPKILLKNNEMYTLANTGEIKRTMNSTNEIEEITKVLEDATSRGRINEDERISSEGCDVVLCFDGQCAESQRENRLHNNIAASQVPHKVLRVAKKAKQVRSPRVKGRARTLKKDNVQFKYRRIKMESHKRFQCHWCSKAFMIKSYLTNHITHSHGDSLLKCEKCLRAFSSQALLIKHVSACLMSDVCSKDFKKIPYYTCNLCNDTFANRKGMAVHRRRKHAFQCDWCFKTFTHKQSVDRHIAELHVRNNIHECGVCQRKYARRGDMHLHQMKKHKNYLTSYCDVCPKGYILKNDLVKHMVRGRHKILPKH